MKRFLSAVVAITFAAQWASAEGSYGLPDDIQQGNILHCFDWKLSDVKAELAGIAEAGFGAVQVSPLQRNVSAGTVWYDIYRPYDFVYVSNTGIGTADELRSLCSEAANYGIKIVVDVVFNHVDGTSSNHSSYHDTWWNSNDRLRWNGNVDYGSRYSITHNQLGGSSGYPDVNSELSDVQARAKAYIEHLKSLGVAGIRFDAAKHIALPSEGCDFWPEITSVSGLYYYGEVLDSPGGDGNSLIQEYANYMSITDNSYSSKARNGNGVPSSQAGWANGTISEDKVVYWAESHDTYCNDGGESKNTGQEQIDRAYAIVACRSGATALYFSRPSSQNNNDIKIGDKGSTHYASSCVAEVNKFRNAMVGKDDYFVQSGGVACVTRQDGGAVIVRSGGGGSVSIANGGGYCPEGTYTDRVSGGTFTVTGSTITGTVGSSGIAVIYDGDSGGDATPRVAASLESGTAFMESVVVTLSVSPDATIYYTTDGSAPSTSSSRYASALTLTETTTLRTLAVASDGNQRSQSFYYNKISVGDYYCFFNNTSGWNPYVWTWNSSENCCYSDSWPGDAMTPLSGGKYYWEAPEGKVPTGIIISDNGSTKAGGGDLLFVNGATYNPDGSYSMGGVAAAEATAARVVGAAGSISVTGLSGERVVVAGIDGKVYYSGRPRASEVTINVARGVYIVNVAGSGMRVAVR